MSEDELTRMVGVPGEPGLFANRLGQVATLNHKAELVILNPYQRVDYRRASGKKTGTFVHRIVAKTFIGPCRDSSSVVRHLDGNPSNNRADNLAYGTRAQNIADATAHGTNAFAPGEAHMNSKLKDADVRMIRDLVAQGFAKKEVARQFGISPKLVRCIVLRESWSHIN